MTNDHAQSLVDSQYGSWLLKINIRIQANMRSLRNRRLKTREKSACAVSIAQRAGLDASLGGLVSKWTFSNAE
jgi:hypothetical protein